MISNNSQINGLNIENLNQKTFQEKSCLRNYVMDPLKRFEYINNDSNQTIIMIGNQTCSRRSSEYLPLKVLESYL